MGVQAKEIAETFRTVMAASSPTQRWSDPQLLRLIDRAVKEVVRYILWPTSGYVFNTQMGAQRYRIPEMLETLQVYMGGQPLVRTDIETLGGDDINFWDQTGTGGGPGGLINWGQPPVLAGGQYTPQWTSQEAEAYPVASSLGTDVNTASPWYPGMRPRYFYDSGVLGFVPAPAGVYPVFIRGVRQPSTLNNMTNEIATPDVAFDAVLWRTIEYACFGDAEKPAAQQQMQAASMKAMQAFKDLRKWKRGYTGGHTRGPNFLTYRGFYSRGNNRNFGASGNE